MNLRIIVEVPTKLSKDQKRAIENLDENIEMKQYERMKRYSDHVEALYGEKPFKN